MTDRSSELLARLALPLYFVAVLLAFSPVVELLISLFPLRVGELQWRFASAGFVSGILLSMLLGVVLALLISVALEHTRMSRVIGLVSVIVGAGLVVLLAFFSLDTLQLRVSIRPEAKHAFKLAALKAGLKYLTASLAFLWVGIVAFRASRAAAVPRSKRERSASPLIATAPAVAKPESTDR